MIELNRIYCESNLETMQRMPDCFIDLTVTSPPYDNLREYKGFKFPFKHIARHLYRVTKFGGVVVWVVGDATINGSETGTSFQQALFFKECGFRLHDTMIYQTGKPPMTHNRYEQEFEYMFIFSKGRPNVFNPIKSTKNHIETRVRNKKWRREKDGSHDLGFTNTGTQKIIGNVWYVESGVFDDKISYTHPAVFPEELAEKQIKTWSNEGDIVYDPFSGSGTTVKMAHLLNRKWIGSEISKEYVELSMKRLKPYLSQQSLFTPENLRA